MSSCCVILTQSIISNFCGVLLKAATLSNWTWLGIVFFALLVAGDWSFLAEVFFAPIWSIIWLPDSCSVSKLLISFFTGDEKTDSYCFSETLNESFWAASLADWRSFWIKLYDLRTYLLLLSLLLSLARKAFWLLELKLWRQELLYLFMRFWISLAFSNRKL